MKAIAQACAGERLLLNWLEQDNYRTIAGAAIAYGHAVVSQSPIDVNIGKQLNILLTGMDVQPGQIIMDPMTGAVGYGIEYTYSGQCNMPRQRSAATATLAYPMIVSPAQDVPRLRIGGVFWRSTFRPGGMRPSAPPCGNWRRQRSLLYAGADILIMYNPEASMALKRMILRLMDGN